MVAMVVFVAMAHAEVLCNGIVRKPPSLVGKVVMFVSRIFCGLKRHTHFRHALQVKGLVLQ